MTGAVTAGETAYVPVAPVMGPSVRLAPSPRSTISGMYPSFFDELRKIAATVGELAAGVRRLNPIRIKPTGSLYSKVLPAAGGYLTHPSPAQALGVVQHAPSAERANQLGHMVASHMGVTPEHLQSALEPAYTNAPRMIAIQKGEGVLPTLTGVSSPEGKRALHNAAVLHEGFERAVKPHQVAMNYHLSDPQVISKEHNLMARMTGPGAEETVQGMQDLRRMTGESAAFHDTLHRAFPNLPEGYGVYGTGEKIRPAMRKRLTQLVREGKVPWKADAPAGFADKIRAAVSGEEVEGVGRVRGVFVE